MADDFRFVDPSELEGDPPLIIGLSGMSDSGKTYSALLIAQAIARKRGGFVAAIDTEGRIKKYQDAKIYAELHPFQALRWHPPFDGERAIAACKAALEAGAACIILDSASDEWEGEGGVLQSHDAHQQDMAGGNAAKLDKVNMPAWARAKKPHQKWHSFMLSLPVPIILCHRARRKVRMTGGKVIDAGVQPICDDRLVYDMMFHLLMDEERRDGSYKVLKGGYRHERHVFPGGRVDADAIGRLMSVAVAPDATPEPPPAGIQWRPNAAHVYEPDGDGEVDGEASQRALFAALRGGLEGDEDAARAIAAANQTAIMALPAKGRDALLAIIKRRGLGE